MGDQKRICFELGTRAYPRIDWSWDDFERKWALGDESNRKVGASQDDYVRLSCLAQRPGSWEVLDAEYIQPLRASVLRVSESSEAADLALQRFRVLLAEPSSKLAAYRPVGSFRAWMRVVAVRTALEVSRESRRRAAREDELTDRLAQLTTGPEARYARAEINAELRRALCVAVRALPTEERLALRLHLVSRWNISQIGRTLSVHRSTAARMLVAARNKVKEAMRAELSRRKGAAFDDTGEAWSELPSRLDLSLTQLFATTGAQVTTDPSTGDHA